MEGEDKVLQLLLLPLLQARARQRGVETSAKEDGQRLINGTGTVKIVGSLRKN